MSRVRRKISRRAAFAAQGVPLKVPAASWSGVRTDDGMVVFAVRVEDVIADAHGSRCLLWAPQADDAQTAVVDERLKHCLLALGHGQAEGMLAFDDGATVDAELVLAVRVERQRDRFWAKWGLAKMPLALPPETGWSRFNERVALG